MPLPSQFTFLGIAKEAVRGTPVTAVDYLPVTSLAPQDQISYLPDKGLRGSAVEVYDEIAGPTWSEYGFGGEVFADTIGYVLAGLLGDVVTTGASAPFSHVSATKNSGDSQPTSYTISDYNGTQTRQFAAAQFGSAAFKFSGDGLLSYDAKAFGNASVTTTKPTPAFTAIKPVAAWRGALTIAGSGVVTLVDGTCEIKRPITPIHTVDGSANPYRLWAGPVSAEGKLTFVAEDESELIRYLTNTQPSLAIDFSQGAGAALTQVKFVMTRAAYTDAQITRGKDYVSVDVKYTAIANTTDVGASAGYSPIKTTLQNAKASGTYV